MRGHDSWVTERVAGGVSVAIAISRLFSYSRFRYTKEVRLCRSVNLVNKKIREWHHLCCSVCPSLWNSKWGVERVLWNMCCFSSTWWSRWVWVKGGITGSVTIDGQWTVKPTVGIALWRDAQLLLWNLKKSKYWEGCSKGAYIRFDKAIFLFFTGANGQYFSLNMLTKITKQRSL